MPVFIWYLLNVFKALVFQDILSKFCSLAVHHNFFFFGRVQETSSPDLFAASSDRGGATWEGGANGWQLKKTPETEHCFPVISEIVHTITVACRLLSWSLLECTLEITRHSYYLHDSTPHYQQSKNGRSNWWETSDRIWEMFLCEYIGGPLALYSDAL